MKSTKNGIERILKPGIQNKGYLTVELCYHGKKKTCTVHRLVAKAFIPNPAGLPCVNHKDEMKTHNFADNLEWCSVTYNNNFGTAKQRISATLLNYPAFSKPVRQLSLEGEVIAIYPSIAEAARLSGLPVSTIWSSAKGITKNPKQFKWEYI